MTREQNVLLKLINQSQFGLSNPVCYDEVDFDALFFEATQQSIFGLIASEFLTKCPEEKYLHEQHKMKAHYIRYNHAEEELTNLLSKFEIPHVILKGNASAVYYTDPSCRSMGDIDFLVPQELYSKVKQILIMNDFIEGHSDERHTKFSKNGILFELHHHFSYDIDLESNIVEGLKNCEVAYVNGHSFPMLPKLANGLVLLDHFRRHLKDSVGLRQVIDWMMYVYHDLDDEFWNNDFGPIVREKGLESLAKVTTRMCQIYLGLSESITWCKDVDDELCNKLMKLVVDSGNFGRKNNVGRSIEAVSSSIKKVGLFHKLQESGKNNWKAYHKHHWLLPFCWIYQIFRYAKLGIKSGRSPEQLRSDLDRSKSRMEILKELGID